MAQEKAALLEKCPSCNNTLERRGNEDYCTSCDNYVWDCTPTASPGQNAKHKKNEASPRKENKLEAVPQIQDLYINKQFKAPEGEDMPERNYMAEYVYCREARRWGEKWLVYFRIIIGKYAGNEVCYPVRPPDPDKEVLPHANLHRLITKVCRAAGGGFNPPKISSIDDLDCWLQEKCRGLQFHVQCEQVLKDGKGNNKRRIYSRIKKIIK